MAAGTEGHPERVAQPGGLIDVAPNILDFLKLPVPQQFSGASLLPPARSGKDDGQAVVSESVYPRDAFHWVALRSIRAGPWQYIDAPHPELHDLTRDPGEHRNLAAENANLAGTLPVRLNETIARSSGGNGSARQAGP